MGEIELMGMGVHSSWVSDERKGRMMRLGECSVSGRVQAVRWGMSHPNGIADNLGGNHKCRDQETVLRGTAGGNEPNYR